MFDTVMQVPRSSVVPNLRFGTKTDPQKGIGRIMSDLFVAVQRHADDPPPCQLPCSAAIERIPKSPEAIRPSTGRTPPLDDPSFVFFLLGPVPQN